MRAMDLDLRELLTFEPKGGVIRFGGQRALILDAVALGILRKELIDSLGLTAARGILTRFGYAHGWRTAESLRTEFPWESENEWRVAGARLHMLQGLVVVEQPDRPWTDGPVPFAQFDRNLLRLAHQAGQSWSASNQDRLDAIRLSRRPRFSAATASAFASGGRPARFGPR